MGGVVTDLGRLALAGAIPLYLPVATTRMRRGETAGLLWHDLDLDAVPLTTDQQGRIGLGPTHRERSRGTHQHWPRPLSLRRTGPTGQAAATFDAAAHW